MCPTEHQMLAELAAKVAFLRQAESYGGPSGPIQAIETHMSWVFLTDRHAYKLKKPVRMPFLDFSTVERRRHFCQEELRLNRRLAAETYLAVLALTGLPDGGLEIAGDGPVVDWLVKMVRIPAERMLDRAIAGGTASEPQIDAVAARLAGFYRSARRIDRTPIAYLHRVEGEIASSLAALRDLAGLLSLEQVERIHAAQRSFVGGAAAMFMRRAAEGRIVEAHGDLRPEHVYLGPPPQIIDCLEFSEEFRTLDPAEELAFLAMECELLGAARVGEQFLACYRRIAGDQPPQALIEFHKSCRACLRSKLAAWHLHEVPVRHAERWPILARRYLALADRYAARLAAL